MSLTMKPPQKSIFKKAAEKFTSRGVFPFSHSFVLTIALVFATMTIIGCYGTQTVKIRTLVDSKVNIKEHQKIAVMDFVDVRKNAATDQGKILSRMIRKKLRKNKEFSVLQEKDMNNALEREIDRDKVESPDFLIAVSQKLGVDSLIVGTYNFYRINQVVPYVVERYYPRIGGYRPRTGTYLQRVNRLELHARLVDGRTGKTIYDFNPPPEEKPELKSGFGLPFADTSPDPEVLRMIAARLISDFVLSLVPHYEYEKRILVE